MANNHNGARGCGTPNGTLDIKDEGQNPQHSNCSAPTKRRQSKKPLSINLSYDVRRPLYYAHKAGCFQVS